jgi:DNA-binding GntR family transcriptional regulator
VSNNIWKFYRIIYKVNTNNILFDRIVDTCKEFLHLSYSNLKGVTKAMMIDNKEGSTKSDIVYNYVKEKILNGGYHPGDRIVTREVGRQLGVSDIPVREAIKRLAADGLLEVKSHSGARISHLNIKNLEEIFTIRIELETLAARLAAKSATAEEIATLEEYTNKMEETIRRNNISEFTRYNREFHKLLYRSSHSSVLIDMIENLYMRSENSKTIFQHEPERLKSSNEEHRAIVEALRNRDEKEAVRLIRFQKEHGFKTVLNALKLSQSLLGN